ATSQAATPTNAAGPDAPSGSAGTSRHRRPFERLSTDAKIVSEASSPRATPSRPQGQQLSVAGTTSSGKTNWSELPSPENACKPHASRAITEAIGRVVGTRLYATSLHAVVRSGG